MSQRIIWGKVRTTPMPPDLYDPNNLIKGEQCHQQALLLNFSEDKPTPDLDP